MMESIQEPLFNFLQILREGEFQFELGWYLRFWKFVLISLILLCSLPCFIKYFWRSKLLSFGLPKSFFQKKGLASLRFDIFWCSLIVSTGMIIFFTLLGPTIQREEKIPQKAAITVVVGIDGSASSLAPIKKGSDISRLDLMKSSVQEVFERLPHDKKGFFVFAHRIIAQSSVLTTDYERILKPELADLSEWFIADVGRGTNFALALKGCYDQFSEKNAEGICVILSDGEQQGDEEKLEKDLAEALTELSTKIYDKHLKVKFYIIPVGDPTEALRIPKRDFEGNINGFVSGKDGQFLKTRPDYLFLEHIASIIEAKFITLEQGDEIKEALRDVIEKERKTVSHATVITKYDLSWIGFLFIAVGIVFTIRFWK